MPRGNRLSLGVPYVASYVVTRCANPTRGYVMTPRGTQLIDKLSIGLNLMPFDPVGEFLTACCVRDAKASVASGTLFEAYEAWCIQNREMALSRNVFGEQLAAHGFTPDRTGHGRQRIWRGLRLMTDGERLMAAARPNAATPLGKSAAVPEPPPPASDTSPADALPGPSAASGRAPASALPGARPTSPDTPTTTTTREKEILPWLPPNLPERLQDWPVAWREFFLTQMTALEREEGLNPAEATQHALTITRQDYRDALMPRMQIAAQVAAAVGADLQALSIRLGKDLHTLGDEERVQLQLKLHSLQADWSGWSTAEKDQLHLYFTRYHLEWHRQNPIRKAQRWEAAPGKFEAERFASTAQK